MTAHNPISANTETRQSASRRFIPFFAVLVGFSDSRFFRLTVAPESIAGVSILLNKLSGHHVHLAKSFPVIRQSGMAPMRCPRRRFYTWVSGFLSALNHRSDNSQAPQLT